MATATKPTRYQEIAQLGAAFFEAVKEHTKISQQEADALMDAAARHIRSASPQSMLKPQPPLTAVKVPLGNEGAFYGVTSIGEGVVVVISEASGRDAATPPLTLEQAETFARDVMAVRAAREAEAAR